MFWNEQIETIGRKDLEKLQLAKLQKALAAAASTPFYKKVFTDNGVDVSRVTTLDHLRDLPFTSKARPAAQLSRRHGGGPAQRDRAAARVVRHHGKIHGHLLHREGHIRMGRPHRAQHDGDRHHPGRRVPEHDGLRPLHRRPGPALRRRAARLHGHPRVDGQQPEADPADAGLPHHGHPHHAELCPAPGGRGDRAGRQPARPGREEGLSRRRAVLRGDAKQDRGAVGARGVQLLRPLRDERPRRRVRVRAQERHAPLGGLLHHGDHQSRYRRAASRTARRESWCSPTSTARPCPSSATGPGT